VIPKVFLLKRKFSSTLLTEYFGHSKCPKIDSKYLQYSGIVEADTKELTY